MPSTCCVPGCRGNYSCGGPKVSTHKFPKDEILKQKWILAIRRKDFIITEHSRVCELHFKESDFETEASAFDSKTGKTLTAPLNVKRLKKGVVPSLQFQSKTSKSTSSSNRETPDEKRSRLEKEQLTIAMEESLRSASGENSSTEDMPGTSSRSRPTENEVTNSVKRKGTKRKGISENAESASKAVNGFTGISFTIQQSPSKNNCTNSSDLVNQSTHTLLNVQIKEEAPWEEEYNYITNTSSNGDTVKITSVQSLTSIQEENNLSSERVITPSIKPVLSNENEDSVPLQKEATSKSCEGCDTTFYKKPLNMDNRDKAFGTYVACEMSDLRSNPDLYLKTQQSISKLLVEAHFQHMCRSDAV